MLQTEKYSIQVKSGLVIFEAKEISPVLISVPHDGLPFFEFSGFFRPREIGYRGRDRHIWPIAKDILLDTNVNAVRGLMPRALVDYNRSWPIGVNYYPRTQKEVHTALDDERLASVYLRYHDTIDRILNGAIGKFGREKTLLIDLHGFAKQPPYAPDGGYDLILGTGNRVSIPHGDVDIRLAQYMCGCGYKVFLPKDMSVGPVEDYYSADFTTRHHSEKHGVNVIQIEVAARFRMKGAQEIGKKLSRDFAGFLNSNCL